MITAPEDSWVAQIVAVQAARAGLSGIGVRLAHGGRGKATRGDAEHPGGYVVLPTDVVDRRTLRAVIAHEIGHLALGHVDRRRGGLREVGMAVAAWVVVAGPVMMVLPRTGTPLLVTALAFVLGPVAASTLTFERLIRRRQRQAELDADAFAARLLVDWRRAAAGLYDGEERYAVWWRAWWWCAGSTHPPDAERVAHLRSMSDPSAVRALLARVYEAQETRCPPTADASSVAKRGT